MWPLGLGVTFGGDREWALCKQMRESLPVQRGATHRHQTQGSSGDGPSEQESRGEGHSLVRFQAFSDSFLMPVSQEMLLPILRFYEISLSFQ